MAGQDLDMKIQMKKKRKKKKTTEWSFSALFGLIAVSKKIKKKEKTWRTQDKVNFDLAAGEHAPVLEGGEGGVPEVAPLLPPPDVVGAN